MEKTISTVLLASLAIAVSVSLSRFASADPSDLKTLPIDSPAPVFKLPGVDDRIYSLQDFAQAKVLVVVFTCNHCPTAQAYEDRIIRLYDEYKPRGVEVVAISPNDPLAVRLDELGYTDLSDSLEEMKIRAKDRGFRFPYLFDGTKQQAAKAYGALATPHLFIFDSARRLRYTGRFDDSDVKVVKSHDARDAIEALLAGDSVPVPVTKVFGCSTKWSDKRASAAESIERWNREPVTLTRVDVEGVRKLAQNESKNLRLINVWATWCGPCVAELEEFVTINRMYRGRNFELVTISADSPVTGEEVALKVLTDKHVSSRNYLFNSDDKYALIDALDKQWPGPLPHTVLVEPGGKVIYRHNGAVDALELKRAIVGYLGRTY